MNKTPEGYEEITPGLTFQPDARPWLPIAEYDRGKHGEWIEGKRLVFRAEPWEISWDKERAWWKNRAGNIVGEVTHFRFRDPNAAQPMGE